VKQLARMPVTHVGVVGIRFVAAFRWKAEPIIGLLRVRQPGLRCFPHGRKPEYSAIVSIELESAAFRCPISPVTTP
jgi:hypothetical protein